MNLDQISAKLREAKIPLLLLCAGLLLVLTGGHESRTGASTDDRGAAAVMESLDESEERLTSLLQEIDGVGEVHVLLSYETTSETEYVSDNGETVLLSSGGGTEAALAKYMRYPRYQGAVIVCRGADQASVRLHVMEATARFTGLGTDRITVLQLRK